MPNPPGATVCSSEPTGPYHARPHSSIHVCDRDIAAAVIEHAHPVPGTDLPRRRIVRVQIRDSGLGVHVGTVAECRVHAVVVLRETNSSGNLRTRSGSPKRDSTGGV